MDPRTLSSDDLERGTAGLALLVGLAAAAAPATLARVYGADPDEAAGFGGLGWRLFASRNLVVGTAALTGSRPARDAILIIQLPDQIAFAHAFLTRAVPRPTALAAMLTSGAIVAAGLRARATRVPAS